MRAERCFSSDLNVRLQMLELHGMILGLEDGFAGSKGVF